ncbi:MAG: glutamate formimidoyltransferase [Anaerolineales bacterium]|nr:glutamate formimidoyltransferase [Anaerolineales bacterium]
MPIARPLVECVPNFSEARRPAVVEAIVTALETGGESVRVLNVSSDDDHNRTVVTLVGPPEGVLSAMFAGIATAAQLINLDQHQGEHPRLGATDVVPFVPLRDVTLEACVALARRLGERVGRELGLPVYLYEAAATRPERQNLENIRRGQYEKLKVEIAADPKREPDYGPRRVGPAGAVVIGARAFLVAYNVYLNTADVKIAEKVARAVRHSSGGLRYVKAMGLLVEGQAQVSMNLTDFTQTPVARVVEFVRREAARYGAAVTRSELVGMIPQAALVDAAQWYLQLDNLEHDQVLENRLLADETEDAEPAGPAEAPAASGLTPDFLDALAAGTAAPGGGAAAALTAAMAAALVCMVARLTLGKKKYAAVEGQMHSVLDRAEGLRAALTQAARDDSAAFVGVMAAMQLPKSTPEEEAARADAIDQAYLHATAVPLKVARDAVATLNLSTVVAEVGNRNALSDAGVSGVLAQAGLRGAAMNVRANAGELKDRAVAEAWLMELSGLEARASDALAAIDGLLRDRA